MSWKSLSWSAAALLLLVSLASPFNFMTTFLMMTPFVVLYTMLNTKTFALHAVLIGLIAYFLAGGYGPVVVTLGFFFLVPSIVMGHLYKKGKSARVAILTGFIVVLVQLLLELVLFSAIFDFSLKAELTAMLTESLKQFENGELFKAGWAAETAVAFGDAVMMMLPMLLILSAFMFTIITHGLSRRALRTVGFEAPALPQAKTWKVPRSLVFYYLIAMIASMVMTEEGAGYWNVAIANLVPILRYIFVIQAIGFFYFLADAKKWPRIIPLLLCIPLLLFPPAYIIGLIDAAFPLRKNLVK